MPRTAKAWGESSFTETVKQEILQLDKTLLPLQQGMSYGSYASTENLSVMILSTREKDAKIQVKTGIMFTGIIGGCHCADDPSPNNEHPEYCEVLFEINKSTALATIQLVNDD